MQQNSTKIVSAVLNCLVSLLTFVKIMSAAMQINRNGVDIADKKTRNQKEPLEYLSRPRYSSDSKKKELCWSKVCTTVVSSIEKSQCSVFIVSCSLA